MYSEIPLGSGMKKFRRLALARQNRWRSNCPAGCHLGCGQDRPGGKGDQGDSYQIWDYKTGSTWGYNDRDFCKAGQQIQHLLYSIAAESILGSLPGQGSVKIDLAGYLFPTDKGEGRIIGRRQNRRNVGLQAVEKILELMAEGVFCSSSADTYCKYCDYITVCGGSHAVERQNAKLENDANDCLNGWKELQNYE